MATRAQVKKEEDTREIKCSDGTVIPFRCIPDTVDVFKDGTIGMTMKNGHKVRCSSDEYMHAQWLHTRALEEVVTQTHQENYDYMTTLKDGLNAMQKELKKAQRMNRVMAARITAFNRRRAFRGQPLPLKKKKKVTAAEATLLIPSHVPIGGEMPEMPSPNTPLSDDSSSSYISAASTSPISFLDAAEL